MTKSEPWEFPPTEVGPEMRTWFNRAQEASREAPPLAILATVIDQLLKGLDL